MEFFTVDALNEILLPPFIFLVTFCFLCCQVAEPATNLSAVQERDNLRHSALNEGEARVEETAPIAEESKEIIPVAVRTHESLETNQDALPIEPENPPIESNLSLPELEQSAQELPEEVQKVAAALDNLTKRQARKLMGGLGLQQKRNGIELSTELMTANIKREFKNDPQKFVPVVRDRLPELVLPTENQEDSLKAAS